MECSHLESRSAPQAGMPCSKSSEIDFAPLTLTSFKCYDYEVPGMTCMPATGLQDWITTAQSAKRQSFEFAIQLDCTPPHLKWSSSQHPTQIIQASSRLPYSKGACLERVMSSEQNRVQNQKIKQIPSSVYPGAAAAPEGRTLFFFYMLP